MRKAYNLHIESTFAIEDLIRVIIPKTTVELLKAQKSSMNKHKKGGMLPPHSPDPSFDLKQCQYYVFQLVCKDATVEYVVEGYLPFKYITAAFEDLIAQKDSINRVDEKILIVEEGLSSPKSENEGENA